MSSSDTDSAGARRPSLRELQAQLAEVEAQIARLRGQERQAAIAKIRGMMLRHGVTTAEIFADRSPSTSSTARWTTRASVE